MPNISIYERFRNPEYSIFETYFNLYAFNAKRSEQEFIYSFSLSEHHNIATCVVWVKASSQDELDADVSFGAYSYDYEDTYFSNGVFYQKPLDLNEMDCPWSIPLSFFKDLANILFEELTDSSKTKFEKEEDIFRKYYPL